jgi:hypothetical protein
MKDLIQRLSFLITEDIQKDNGFTLFKEALGDFPYEPPTDKEHMLFDFYMLSYLRQYYGGRDEPSSAHREDLLDYTLDDVQDKLLTAIRKDFLHALYYAVAAEIRHVFDQLEYEMTPEGDDPYTADASAFSKEDLIERLGEFSAEAEDVPEIRNYFSNLYDNTEFDRNQEVRKHASKGLSFDLAKQMDPVKFMSVAAEIFDESGWHGAYGGENWARIARAWLKLRETESGPDLVVILDHIYDLQHNTGTVFNKLKTYAKDGDYDWLKKALDKKKDLVNGREIINQVSPQMKRIANYTLKKFEGTTEQSWLKPGERKKAPFHVTTVPFVFEMQAKMDSILAKIVAKEGTQKYHSSEDINFPSIIKSIKVAGPNTFEFMIYQKHPVLDEKHKKIFCDQVLREIRRVFRSAKIIRTPEIDFDKVESKEDEWDDYFEPPSKEAKKPPGVKFWIRVDPKAGQGSLKDLELLDLMSAYYTESQHYDLKKIRRGKYEFTIHPAKSFRNEKEVEMFVAQEYDKLKNQYPDSIISGQKLANVKYLQLGPNFDKPKKAKSPKRPQKARKKGFTFLIRVEPGSASDKKFGKMVVKALLYYGKSKAYDVKKIEPGKYEYTVIPPKLDERQLYELLDKEHSTLKGLYPDALITGPKGSAVVKPPGEQYGWIKPKPQPQPRASKNVLQFRMSNALWPLGSKNWDITQSWIGNVIKIGDGFTLKLIPDGPFDYTIYVGSPEILSTYGIADLSMKLNKFLNKHLPDKVQAHYVCEGPSKKKITKWDEKSIFSQEPQRLARPKKKLTDPIHQIGDVKPPREF